VVEQTEFKNPTQKEIITSDVTPVHDMGGGYVEYNNALFQKDALKALYPDLFSAKADIGLSYKSNSNFGTLFPKIAAKGDIFVRVDVLPNRVFKFDGRKWIEVNKNATETYLTNDYIQFLIEKLNKAEYDLEHLSETEREIILEQLKTRNS
jgi:hypothetical protein